MEPATAVVAEVAGKLSAHLTVINQDATLDWIDAAEAVDLSDPVAKLFADSLLQRYPGATIAGYGFLAKTPSVTKYEGELFAVISASGQSLGNVLFLGFGGEGACE